jgi:RNA polymerase sigma factor (sigma-70 family)
MLTKKETTKELIIRFNNSTNDEEKRQLKNTIIEENKDLCISVARKASQKFFGKVDIEDLIQEAMISMSFAIERYDINNEANAIFSTYAYHIIKNALTRYSIQDGMIKVPSGQSEKYYRLNTLKNQGKTEDEICKTLKIKKEKLNELETINGKLYVGSLNQKINQDGEKEIEQIDLVSEESYEEDSVFKMDKIKDKIKEVIKESLTSEERFIILNRYGINKEDKTYTLQLIANHLGITREAVRQKETTIKKKIKKHNRYNEIVEFFKNN